MNFFFDKVNSEISKVAQPHPFLKETSIMCLLPPIEYHSVMRQVGDFMSSAISSGVAAEGSSSREVVKLVIRGVDVYIIAADVPKGFFAHTVSVD